jgi:hypothetical protein
VIISPNTVSRNILGRDSLAEVCILKVYTYQSSIRSILLILTAAAQLWSLSSSSNRQSYDNNRLKVCKLAMYINALGIGELLLKLSDFFKSGAISPYYNSCDSYKPTTLITDILLFATTKYSPF